MKLLHTSLVVLVNGRLLSRVIFDAEARLFHLGFLWLPCQDDQHSALRLEPTRNSNVIESSPC